MILITGVAIFESTSRQMRLNAAKYITSMLAIGCYAMEYIPFWLLVVLLVCFEVAEKLIRTRFEDGRQ